MLWWHIISSLGIGCSVHMTVYVQKGAYVHTQLQLKVGNIPFELSISREVIEDIMEKLLSKDG